MENRNWESDKLANTKPWIELVRSENIWGLLTLQLMFSVLAVNNLYRKGA